MNRIYGLVILSAALALSTGATASSDPNNCKGKKILNCHTNTAGGWVYNGNDSSHITHGDSFNAKTNQTRTWGCAYPTCDIKYQLPPYDGAPTHWKNDFCADVIIKARSATDSTPIMVEGTSCS